MTGSAVFDDRKRNDSLPTKRLYRPPSLTTFGRIHCLTQGTGPVNGDGGQGMMLPSMSDPVLKERVVRVGVHPLGIGLYLFDYKPQYREAFGYGRQFGVMADEVESVMPEAVSLDLSGYQMVNYAMLGMTRTSR